MQNSDPINIIAFIIIISTLVIAFFKYRPKSKKETEFTEVKNETINYELPAIIAVITLMMEKKAFRIKKIALEKREEGSPWRLFGRQEIMRRRANMQQ